MRLAANVESKVPCSDLLAVADPAKAIGAVHARVLMQTDTYLAVTGGRLNLRQISQPRADGTWSSTAELIAHDGPDAVGARVSTYRREPVDDPESHAQALIAEHGLRGVVTKRRELWLLDRTRIHLDDVDALGTFVELETVTGGLGATRRGGRRARLRPVDRVGVVLHRPRRHRSRGANDRHAQTASCAPARSSRSISRAITRRWISCVPS